MAREKLPRNQLSRTAKYYRDNPEADIKHKASSAKAAKKPARKKKNAETRKYRRNNGLEGKGGPDIHHGPNGLMQISASKNRRIK
jgi:hypothetical protein